MKNTLYATNSLRWLVIRTSQCFFPDFHTIHYNRCFCKTFKNADISQPPMQASRHKTMCQELHRNSTFQGWNPIDPAPRLKELRWSDIRNEAHSSWIDGMNNKLKTGVFSPESASFNRKKKAKNSTTDLYFWFFKNFF